MLLGYDSFIYWLRENRVYLDVADDDENERKEEDLSIDDSVVDGMPCLSVDPTQNVFCPVCFRINMLLSQIFKEIYCGALVKLLREALIIFAF